MNQLSIDQIVPGSQFRLDLSHKDGRLRRSYAREIVTSNELRYIDGAVGTEQEGDIMGLDRLWQKRPMAQIYSHASYGSDTRSRLLTILTELNATLILDVLP